MESDERLRWIETHVISSLKPTAEELKQLFGHEHSRSTFLQFFLNEEKSAVFVFKSNEDDQTLYASFDAPEVVGTKFIVFLRVCGSGKITRDNYARSLFYMDWSTNSVEQFEVLTRCIFLPMICIEEKGVVSCDKILDLLHRLMASTQVMVGKDKGVVTLALPSMDVLSEVACYGHRRLTVVHILETVLIGWIKQIKTALKVDIQHYLKKIHGNLPEPLAEIEFWRGRASMIENINAQLSSSQIVDVLTALEDAGSSYARSFHAIKKEIYKAEEEVLHNLIYLGTLEKYFETMTVSCDSDELTLCFKPMMHTLLLIWTYSRFYHAPVNIKRMLTMISNQVVAKAKFIMGDIFIEDIESNKYLKESLRICAAFRGTYLDTKDQADAINRLKVEEQAEFSDDQVGVVWHSSVYRNARTQRGVGLFTKPKHTGMVELEGRWENSPWPVRTSKVFAILNSFMERCNDVIELVAATQQFDKIKMATDNKGAGDVNTNEQIIETCDMFSQALNVFNKNVKDVFEFGKHQQFECSFFHFRSVVQNLEIQLGSILSESLKYGWDTLSKLRLLDVFEDITKRELIQKVLQSTLSQFVVDVMQQVKATEELFLKGVTITSSHLHLPPLTNKLLWLRSLNKRIEQLVKLLNLVAPMCFKGELGWKLKDSFHVLSKDLKRDERDAIVAWLKEFHIGILDKLNEPILVYGLSNIEVNLDDKLLKQLKEIHYLISPPLNVDISDEIMQKVKYVDVTAIRSHSMRLSTALCQYITVLNKLKDIERPLVNDKLIRAEELLKEGLNKLTWKDIRVCDYVENVVHLLCYDLYQTVQCVQENFHSISVIVNTWTARVLELQYAEQLVFPHKVEELNKLKVYEADDINVKIVSGHKKIHTLLSQTFEALHISRSSPQWLAYLQHVNSIVLNGVQESVITSLQNLFNNMVVKSLKNDGDVLPLVQLDVHLIGSIIYFSPPVDRAFATLSLAEYVEQWLDGILARLKLIKFNDQENLKDLHSREIDVMLHHIKELVNEATAECKNLTNIFKDYAFLWTQDVNHTFREFLKGNISNRPYYQSNAEDTRSQASAMSASRSRLDFKDNCSGTSSVATMGVMGFGETKFLKTPNAEDGCPNLDDFDKEIEVFQRAKHELSSAKLTHDLRWIRINFQPIIETIQTYASKWMYTYTKYLADQVQETLNSLDVFLKRIGPDVEAITGKEQDIHSFMKLMRIFNEVSKQQVEIDNKFIAMKRTINLLEKYGQTLPEKTQHFYNAAPGRWDNLKMKVNQAKQVLGPKIQAEESSVIKVLTDFKEQCANIQSEMEDSQVYNRSIVVSAAYTLIHQFQSEIHLLESEAQDLIELQELLEKNIVDFNIINSMFDELLCLRQVWDACRLIRDQQMEWKRHRWHKIKTKLLKRGLDAQYDIIRRLPDKAHGWDVTLSLIEMINELYSCISIMEDFSKVSLRPCYWKQFIRLMAGAINITHDNLIKMNLKNLAELGLHHNAEEVHTVIKKSLEDVSIENKLKLYEEIWLSKVFEIKKHTRLVSDSVKKNSLTGSEFGGVTEPELGFSVQGYTPTAKNTRQSRLYSRASVTQTPDVDGDPTKFLISNVELILEELHSHQMSLESMLKTSSATSFMDDIIKWQKTLQQVEVFINMLIEIQEKWVDLDDIYNSAEMRISCPRESAIFALSSRDFDVVIKSVEKNPNILQVVSTSNIFQNLERITMMLSQCQLTTARYLEKRRFKNPKLLLLSTQEAYSIICKGYDPNLLSQHLHKLFNNINSLKTDISEDGLLYHITGFYSSFGEFIPLQKPIVCENGIENWLSELDTGIKLCNQLNLSTLLNATLTDHLESLHRNKINQDTVFSSSTEKNQRRASKEHEQSVDPDVSSPIQKKDPAASKSDVFTYMLGTLLPLPDNWNFNESSDAIMLSMKVTISSLLNNYFQSYINGNESSLSSCCEKLNAIIVSLSDFLLAQTTIKLQKKNAEMKNCADDIPLNLESLDISLSPVESEYKETDSTLERTETENVNLDVYQIHIIKSLIQYFSNERNFIKNLIHVVFLDLEGDMRIPFEWSIHPFYKFNNTSCMLDVELGDTSWNYEFEFQSVSHCHTELENEKSLYWLASGVKHYEGGFLVSKQRSEGEELLKTLASITGRTLFSCFCTSDLTSDVICDTFKGIASSGCWFCFKNIENLAPLALSTLSVCIKTIHHALTNKQTSITIKQDEITMNPEAMVFGFSSYETYSDIPKCISEHFRIVTYVSPNPKHIIEVGLYNSGMVLSRLLAENIAMFLSTISQIFPCFSMGFGVARLNSLIALIYKFYIKSLANKDGQKIAKELSTVIEVGDDKSNGLPIFSVDCESENNRMSPEGIKSDGKKQAEQDTASEDKEGIERNIQLKSIILGLHQSFAPTLNENDVGIIENLLADAFPQTDVQEMLENNIKCKQSCIVQVDVDSENFDEKEGKAIGTINKAIELLARIENWSELRASIVEDMVEMISSDKVVTISSMIDYWAWECISSCLEAFKKLNNQTKVHIICPPAMKHGQLFGQFDASGKWSDGVLTTSILSAKKELSHPHFFVIDGKLSNEESVIFEGLISQEGCFSLQNGSCIKIPEKMKFIWKVGSLSKSKFFFKTSVVMLDRQQCLWQQLLKSWFQKKNADVRNHLYEWFTQYATKSLEYLNSNTATRSDSENVEYQIVETMLKIFDSITGHVQITSDYDNYANYAAFWAFNNAMRPANREEFSKWWRESWEADICFPDSSEVSNFVVHPNTHLFVNLNGGQYSCVNPTSNLYFTNKSKSILYLANAMIRSSISFTLNGIEGCGKSTLLREGLLNQDTNDFDVVTITANEFLTSSALWERLNEEFKWKHSCYYQPIEKKKLICLIEDIQQCQEDIASNIPACELIYQLIRHSGAYNPSKKQWQQLDGISFIITYNHQRGGYYPSVTRLITNIPSIWMPYPSSEEREKMFVSLLSLHFIGTDDQQLLISRDESLKSDMRKQKERATILQELLTNIVRCTVELQDKMKEMFLPVPERFHYVFNIKALTKIFKSVCVCVPADSSSDIILKGWYHELYWTYFQSSNADVDRERWSKNFRIVLQKKMNQQQMDVIGSVIPIFTNLSIAENADRQSTNISRGQWHCHYHIPKLQQFLNTNIMEFNKDNEKIKLHYYEETTRLIFRLLQLIQSPFSVGHALIVSEGFSGLVPVVMKQVCQLGVNELVTINASDIVYDEKYSLDRFKDDMARVFINCGVKNSKITLLITELDMFEDAVIAIVEEFLQLGTLFHIFKDDEKRIIVNAVRTSGEEKKAKLNTTEVWDVFMQNVRRNLHVVLSLSSMGEKFQKMAYQHPTLVSCMSVICVKHWSKQELVCCARFLMKDFSALSEAEQDNLSHLFASLHTALQHADSDVRLSGTYGNITNKNFELMIERFCLHYGKRKKELEEKKADLKQVLNTSQSSMNSIAQLKKKLEHEKHVFEQKQKGNNTLLTQIGQDRAITEEQVRLVEKTKQKIRKLENLVPTYEESHKRAVFKAAAVVKETKNVLAQLDDKGLSDLRSLQTPDSELEDLLAAVIIIVKSPTSDLTWNRGAKRIMANLERFKEEISVFDESELPESTLEVLRTYINRPHFASGYLENKTHNSVVGSLVSYVHGVVRYNYIMQSRVKPLHAKVIETAERLAEVKMKISTMEEKRKDLNKRLKTLAAKYEEASVEKCKQRDNVENLTELLEKAVQFQLVVKDLIANWESLLACIENEEVLLPSNVVLAAAFSVYMPPYKLSFRKHMLMNVWPKCLAEQGMNAFRGSKSDISFLLVVSSFGSNTEKEESSDSSAHDSYQNHLFVLVRYLIGEELSRHWLTMNLNVDDIENLAMIKSPIQQALLVTDPLNRFSGLISHIKHETQDVVELDMQQRDNTFIQSIEKAVHSGSLLVIRNLDDRIDHLFHSLIYSLCEIQNGKNSVKFNGHRLEQHPNFKLILISRLSSPNIPVEFASLCTCVNFAPNQDSVQNELKWRTYSFLRPELISCKQELYYNACVCMKRIHHIDEAMLKVIKGETDLQQLWTSNSSLDELSKQRKTYSAKLQEVDNQFIQLIQYFKINDHTTKQCTVLFKIMHNMKAVQPHYRFSCEHFFKMFNHFFRKYYERISREERIYQPNDSVMIRIEEMKDVQPPLHDITEEEVTTAMKTFYRMFLRLMKRSLSPIDYEVFSLVYMLCNELYDSAEMDSEFIRILFEDVKINRTKHNEDIIKPDWLPQDRFNHFLNMVQEYPALEKVKSVLETQPSLLKYWYDKPLPEKSLPPQPTGAASSDPQHLRFLIVKALRPDRLYYALKSFVSECCSEVLSMQNDDVSEILKSLEGCRPVLVLQDTNHACAVDVIKKFSKGQSVQVHCVRVSSEFDEVIDDVLTSIVQNDEHLIIENMHLATREVVQKICKRLMRLQMQQQSSSWRVFFVTDNCENLDEPNLRFCHVLSLSAILNKSTDDDLTWSLILQNNVFHSLQVIRNGVSSILQNKSLQMRTLIFCICVFHAYIKSYYDTCAIITCDQVLRDAIQFILTETETKKIDNVLVHDILRMICENIYVATTISSNSLKLVAMDIVYKPTISHKSVICVGDVSIPVPPANVATENYAQWIKDKFDSMKKSREYSGTKSAYLRGVNTKRSANFLRKAQNVMRAISNENKQNIEPYELNVTLLHENIRICMEHMPKLIELKKPDPEDGQIKLISVIFAKECQIFNENLLMIRKCLFSLENNICGGVVAIPDVYRKEAKALSNKHVPPQWIRSDIEKNDYPISDWLQELALTSSHLSEVCSNIKAYFTTKQNIYKIKPINFSCLSDANLIFTLMKHIKATELSSANEIFLDCCLAHPNGAQPISLEYVEPSTVVMATDSLYLQGASIVTQDSAYILDEYRNTVEDIQKMPLVYIWPVNKRSDKLVYDCPVYTDKSRKKFIIRLPIAVKKIPSEWLYSNPCLLLKP
ncbi:uncharacterized protein LOC130636487 isoform X2 [Hydractinia symbiolongicarpus]|uniref:uncharacterized protein LOC130636487 isoform X2 n=1 Tax=Hydractinia symbiolongicarpus TaxID=13093 RepID=UPI00254E3E24|nr:uncharacterized protein LOC130636487 isoform X2 [Hydractinia symbiolongicarpus]